MPPGLDLNVSLKITSELIERIQFEYLNLIAACMLHSLALSQSMGKVSAGFKNARQVECWVQESQEHDQNAQSDFSCLGRR